MCPAEYLIPTKHIIVNITDASLAIVGMALIHLRNGTGQQTRQAVYISKNVEGLYLSESALKDLDIMDRDFPGNNRPEQTRSQGGGKD